MNRERVIGVVQPPQAALSIWVLLVNRLAYGYAVESNPVHIHDLQATLLHQLGLDHTKLTYRHAGREFRLTDVGGRVMRDLIT